MKCSSLFQSFQKTFLLWLVVGIVVAFASPSLEIEATSGSHFKTGGASNHAKLEQGFFLIRCANVARLDCLEQTIECERGSYELNIKANKVDLKASNQFTWVLTVDESA